MKKAVISGITGQDGSYLAEFLLEKGYAVHGIVRRSSSINTHRIEPILGQLKLHEGDLADSFSIQRIIEEVQPDEVYNLAAMSHVKTSFDVPEYTANIDALGALRLLETIRLTAPEAKFYQASTSELFGKVLETPQKETTPFYPRSPYGIAKLYAHWTTINYREAYQLFAANGILFNHESPRRGESFATRKITMGVARIHKGVQKKLILGNLDARRDWGYAQDYVEGMWQMLQLPKPDDFILATGVTTEVRTFVELAFREIGVEVVWEGEGIFEKGIDRDTSEVVVEISPDLFRPAEVDVLCGDASKARRAFGWHPNTTLQELVSMMVQADLALLHTELFA